LYQAFVNVLNKVQGFLSSGSTSHLVERRAKNRRDGLQKLNLAAACAMRGGAAWVT
jgi:hypothetical protein